MPSLCQTVSSLKDLSNNPRIAALNDMLDKPSTVSISWTGARRVSIDGYDGDVDINALVEPLLRSITTSARKPVLFDEVRQKLRVLCKDDSALKKTYLYKFVVPVKESVCTTNRKLFLNMDNPQSLLSLDNEASFDIMAPMIREMFEGH